MTHYPLRILVLATSFLLAAAAFAAPPPVKLTEVASGLRLPVAIASAHDGSGRLYVVEQRGRIRILEGGKVLPTPFLDVSDLVATDNLERGLLGLAFHPDYAKNGAFYVYYTAAHTGAVTIARFLRDRAHPDRADPASRAVLLSIPHAEYASDNGGQLAFGHDGLLYITTGDGGGNADRMRHAQDTGSLLGKMLRIRVDGGARYAIPAGNPFAEDSCAKGHCAEVQHYGLRNPWRFSFDRATGDLYIGDVGEDAWEEVDFLPRDAAAGMNFGWGVFEGNACFNDTYFGAPGACAKLANAVRPVLTYDHKRDGGQAIVGGYVYRGERIAALRGRYVYGDYATKRMWSGWREDGRWKSEVLLAPSADVKAVSSFGEDDRGELYVCDLGNGKIWRIDPAQ
jgi:glucose/arabinose dehydrogenase